MKQLIIFACLALMSATNASAQGEQVPATPALFKCGRDLREQCNAVTPGGWLFLKETSTLSPEAFLKEYTDDLGLQAADALQLFSEEGDDLGMIHYKYAQTHQGIPVEGAQLGLHEKGGKLTLVNTKLVIGISQKASADVPENKALEAALNAIGAAVYPWQETRNEQLADADYYDLPKGKLCYACQDANPADANGYRLVWKFDIVSAEPAGHWSVEVDAQTGEALKTLSLAARCTPSNGKLATLYNGNQLFETEEGTFNGATAYFTNDCRRRISAKRFNGNNLWAQNNLSKDYDNDWFAGGFTQVPTAFWATQQAWEYFNQTFARRGTNNLSREVRVWVDYSPIGDGAAYDYANGVDNIYVHRHNYYSVAAPDIIGHEYAHGVIRETAGLATVGESGALNESIADIFGTATERFALGGSFDWQLGQGVFALRSMSDPHQFGQPETYQEAGWWNPVNQAQDNGGAHTNCGVHNKWFYLLAEGGELNGVTVSGIGFEDAQKIVFRSLSYYLQPYSQFADAREGSVQAAAELFGRCSEQAAQARNAWAAVGVGAPNNLFCIDVRAPFSVCTEDLPAMLNFKAVTVAGASFNWSYPPNWNVTGQNTNIIQAYVPDENGSFTITANATLNGQTVSISKTIHVFPCDGNANADCTDCFFRTASNTNQTPQLYPNPANETVTVLTKNTIVGSGLEILDGIGRIVLETKAKGDENTLDIYSLPAGNYWVSVQTTDGRKTAPLQVVK